MFVFVCVLFVCLFVLCLGFFRSYIVHTMFVVYEEFPISRLARRNIAQC